MTVPVADQPALTACADWCCTKGCVGHPTPAVVPAGPGVPVAGTDGVSFPYSLATVRQECARVCTCGGRATTRLHALVQHYERHLNATGREWVINEAHKRTEAPRD